MDTQQHYKGNGIESVRLKTRRVCSTLVDMVLALVVAIIMGDICKFVIGLVHKIVDPLMAVQTYSIGYGLKEINSIVEYGIGVHALERTIMFTISICFVLILVSPVNIGRRVMRLALRHRDSKPFPTRLLMVRESIKFLWLLPLFWLPLGSLSSDTVPFQLDLVASLKVSWTVLVFPLFILVWILGIVECPIHDIVCGTQVHPTSLRISGCLAGNFGCALSASCLLFLGLYQCSYSGSYYAMRGIYLWDLTGDFSAGEGDVIPIYEGLPRYVTTFDFYTGAVLIWTLIVFVTVRVQDRWRLGGAPGASESVEGDRVGASADETSDADPTLRP